MGKFAPVAPLAVAAELMPDELGDYHLLLAHDVLKYPQTYRRIYHPEVLGKGTTTIMDNSLIELGEAVPMEKVLEAANIVGAQFLVFSDRLKDLVWTLEATKADLAAYKRISDQHFSGTPQTLPKPMAVVQGSNMVEINYCIHTYREMGFEAIAIPRVLTEVAGSRVPIIYEAVELGFEYIHLLGFSDNFRDDVVSASLPGVMGIDSAVPVRMGLKGIKISMDNYIDPGKRGDYWDNPFQDNHTRESMTFKMMEVVNNLRRIRKFIK